MHRVLKQALGQAVKWQLLSRNPADAVDPPKVERKAMQTYDMAQTVELIEHMRPTRMLVPTVLAVLCGLRRGEIAALRWRNVDLGAAQLAVVESAEQTKAGIRYKEPKAGRTRNVVLSSTVIEELQAWRVRQAQELLRLGIRAGGETFVVTQADGNPLQPNSLTHEWVRLLASSNLPRLRLPRSATRPRNAPVGLWRPSQGRQRTAGPLQGRDHPRPLQPRHAGDAGGCRRQGGCRAQSGP